ncbi:GNAT family N-acetyltransferase [Spirosoma sp. HMF4905]|uniref:GNAT family N-acetyltransferase n=1 Tax=Spirosoma arboris TaxID=2682092 RepID=A0A7K1SB85_9BACT|nr:GNAT family N-acetyltransferase [Spirosoma arboris]MVM31040.1 GNAT family N-acetyltransferase [Spirosoma arboris]
MTKTLKIVPRHQIDSIAWDACVAASPQRMLYGYSWYLDAVLPAPTWKWVGIISIDESGRYRAIMPVPLRRKVIAGITYEWVVHQPFFCQFLDVFSPDGSVDSSPFFQLTIEQFRYGSVFCTRSQSNKLSDIGPTEQLTTHILDLSADYKTIYQNYSHDRKLNLRRARHEFNAVANWTIVESGDPEPLLTLFRQHHAETIDGGVADWAYAIFRKLTNELSKRGLVTLRYAQHDGQLEAGALFVCEGNRIIYLFNAASEIGRKANARTLLIDQLIQEKAGQSFVFDFESPAKPSIQAFYQSFGATEEPFGMMRWNRLTFIERVLLKLKNRF